MQPKTDIFRVDIVECVLNNGRVAVKGGLGFFLGKEGVENI